MKFSTYLPINFNILDYNVLLPTLLVFVYKVSIEHDSIKMYHTKPKQNI